MPSLGSVPQYPEVNMYYRPALKEATFILQEKSVFGCKKFCFAIIFTYCIYQKTKNYRMHVKEHLLNTALNILFSHSYLVKINISCTGPKWYYS